MTEADELARALDDVAAALEALGVVWAVGGSVASAAHGEPRATNDVDVIGALDQSAAARFIELLGPTFYGDVEAAREAARTHASFNVIDQRSFIKVDVFVPAPGPLGLGQLERRCVLDILPGARPLPLLGPEDKIATEVGVSSLDEATSVACRLGSTAWPISA